MKSEDVENWLMEILGPTYTLQVGQLVEAGSDANKWFAVVRGSGGTSPVVDTRRKRFELIVVGRRGKQADAAALENACESIMQAIMQGVMPCGAAIISATSEPIGPGFTTENRAWYQLNVQVTF